jgi:hypothetical protein
MNVGDTRERIGESTELAVLTRLLKVCLREESVVLAVSVIGPREEHPAFADNCFALDAQRTISGFATRELKRIRPVLIRAGQSHADRDADAARTSRMKTAEVAHSAPLVNCADEAAAGLRDVAKEPQGVEQVGLSGRVWTDDEGSLSEP